MQFHPAATRGEAFHGWLETHHTFSFSDYYDPERMGFGVLRVINDDVIAPGAGFARHPHRDMEIITIPLEGGLQHMDSIGNSAVITSGEVQVMSAGTGVFHSEVNASSEKRVKILQIWVLPKVKNVEPRYEQKRFNLTANSSQLVVSPDGREGSNSINQDAFFTLSKWEANQEFTHEGRVPKNGCYVFVIRGSVNVNGTVLHERDGLGLEAFSALEVTTLSDSELLFMEVPML